MLLDRVMERPAPVLKELALVVFSHSVVGGAG
jgi:hypothetical protein